MADKIVADRRLYCTVDGRVVEAGDPESAALLAVAGRVIPEAIVQRYGLSVQDGKVVVPGQKMRAAPEDKMVRAAESKAVDDGAEEPEAEAEEWSLQMSPAEYLERYPDGPNADLARRLVDAD